VTQSNKTSILLIAGDVSGDFNAAKLARTLLERHPDWALYAVGGPYLGAEVTKSPGGRLIEDSSDLSAMGITSVIKIIPRSLAMAFRMRKFVRAHSIDAVVMCDWGAFNCRQFDFFKEAGIPVLYYFPPGSWHRTGTSGLGIVPWVDRVATPFEWSAQRLTAAGCKAEWVGHPMLETQYTEEKRVQLRAEFGAGPNEKLVALLPGSRLPEIKHLGPRLAAVAEILRAKKGGTQFVVATPQHRVEAVKKHFPDWVKIVSDRAADVLFACDAAVVKSGTGTLEAAVIGAPQVAVYDVGWLTRIEWVLLWMYKKIPFVTLPNIILQRLAVQELLGLNCTSEKIAQAISELLEDESRRAKMAEDYREIREKLGARLPLPATQRTAEILEELLLEKKTP
jgi:lipid-A-disaccharide synthase